MTHFVKLYGSITTSSVWAEAHATRIVWITMLALADQDGKVDAAIPGLAQVAGVTLKECEDAVAVLSEADRYSRTKTDAGRRIQEVDGGWTILNHRKYRDLRTEKQIADAERQRKHRERDTSQMSHDVATEAEAYTEVDTSSSSTSPVVSAEFEPDLMELIARVQDAGGSMKAWEAELRVAGDGMHGPPASPDQIGQAVRDFNGNGAAPVLRLFRAFLRSAVAGPKPKPRKNSSDRVSRGVAAISHYLNSPETDNGN